MPLQKRRFSRRECSRLSVRRYLRPGNKFSRRDSTRWSACGNEDMDSNSCNLERAVIAKRVYIQFSFQNNVEGLRRIDQMSTQRQRHTKDTLQSSFTPAPKALLQRQCA